MSPSEAQTPRMEATEAEWGIVGKLLGALSSSDDLLSPHEAAKQRVVMVQGHCYVMSEAFVHAVGGLASGYRPARLRVGPDSVHWWVVSPDGRILDITGAQYLRWPPHDQGRRAWFLTAQPSKRALKLLERAGISL